jgi:hypothetical protein
LEIEHFFDSLLLERRFFKHVFDNGRKKRGLIRVTASHGRMNPVRVVFVGVIAVFPVYRTLIVCQHGGMAENASFRFRRRMPDSGYENVIITALS